MSAPQMTVEENIDEQRTREQVEQLKLEQVASDVSDAVLETKEVKSYALDSESDGVNHINDYPKEKPVEDGKLSFFFFEANSCLVNLLITIPIDVFRCFGCGQGRSMCC